MAFTNSQLALVAYSGASPGGMKVFTYANTAADTVTAAGFFNSALVPQNLKVGDVIIAQNIGELFRVSAIASGVVTVVQTT